MKITWNDSIGREQTKLLSTIITEDFNVSGVYEEMEHKIECLSEFCFKTIDILYNKGILDDKDILNILQEFMHIENIKEITF